MAGTLYGIGVGPGDPELLTLKAVRCIKESDVLFLPASSKETCYAYQTAFVALPEIAEKECVCLAFPMTKDAKRLQEQHTDIYRRIKGYLLQNRTAGFLTIGDPCVYSTFHFIQERAAAEGFAVHTVSGVPSFCAAAAAAGMTLADSGEQIHIIPASYEENSAGLCGTRIYMKAGSKLGELKECLMREMEQSGKSYEIWAVSNCGMPNEKIYRGLSELDGDSGYLTIVIARERKPET